MTTFSAAEMSFTICKAVEKGKFTLSPSELHALPQLRNFCPQNPPTLTPNVHTLAMPVLKQQYKFKHG